MHTNLEKFTLTDLRPENMYLTSWEIKQLSCRKLSLLCVGGSSSASVHLSSTSKVPPKYWSINDLE